MTQHTTALRAACHALCNSRKFETGQGGCAAICMSMLGSSRPNCQYQQHVHSELAAAVLKAAKEAGPVWREPSIEERPY